jgi:hypothetical protein
MDMLSKKIGVCHLLRASPVPVGGKMKLSNYIGKIRRRAVARELAAPGKEATRGLRDKQ